MTENRVKIQFAITPICSAAIAQPVVMKFTFCLVALVSARTLWTDLQNSEYTFDQYKAEFNKNYPDADEHASREQRFNAEITKIRQHNAADHSWKMGVNQFTDMTNSEFKMFKGLKRDGNMEGASPFDIPLLPVSDLPANKDWRDASPAVVTPVKVRISRHSIVAVKSNLSHASSYLVCWCDWLTILPAALTEPGRLWLMVSDSEPFYCLS